MSVISTTTPLSAGGVYTSATVAIQRATQLTGTAYSDQAGTLMVQQSGDGINWDWLQSYTVNPGVGVGFETDVLSPYWRIVYTNGGVLQSVFRLYADPRDPYGDFLASAQAPSAGGAFAVLRYEVGSGSYTYVGRFDGVDGWGACGAAAIYSGTSAKYAAFPVTAAVVSDETIQQTTEHTPDAF